MTRDNLTALLDEMQARSDAATEGPWSLDQDWATVASGSDSVIHGYYDDKCPACGDEFTSEAHVAIFIEDAEFIAAARTDLPRLIAAVRAVLAINTGDNRALYGLDFEAGMCKALYLVHAAIATALKGES